MKKLLTACFGIMAFVAGAQNNAIFNGGAADGWNNNAHAQTASNIFVGGTGDGWVFSLFSQTVVNIFAGGNADGWAFKNYIQAGNAIFAGGDGDGWSYLGFAQAGNAIFDGGNGDGWANSYRALGPLPVQFIAFTAEKLGSVVVLNWQTGREEAAAYFEVERSADAMRFAKIGRVAAIGNFVGTRQYSFTDAAPLGGNNYYRLKQVDANGVYVYTPTRMVVFKTADMLKVYPVPATTMLTIAVPTALQNVPVVINLNNAAGILVQQVRLQKGGTLQTLNLKTLPPGIYHLQVASKERNITTSFVKQ